jgi:predicted nucleic acid-binding protein
VIVVDTSVLVDLFRGADTPQVRLLEQLEQDRTPFALPAICCQELLQGALDASEWRLLEAYLATQELLSSADPWLTHREAARIYFDCRRKGLTPRSTVDCLVAQLVMENDGRLLHADADYERISRVRPLRLISVA